MESPKSWKNFRTQIENDASANTIFGAIEAMEQTAGEASEETCDLIIKGIAKESKMTEANALIACACILQKGGTARNAPGTLRMTIDQNTVSLDSIRRHCRATKDTKVRQFARGIKDEIIDIMQYLGDKAPEGNLAKTMRLDRYVEKSEAVWCSDFQTYNENCPESVRTWLVRNYKSRFRKN